MKAEKARKSFSPHRYLTDTERIKKLKETLAKEPGELKRFFIYLKNNWLYIIRDLLLLLILCVGIAQILLFIIPKSLLNNIDYIAAVWSISLIISAVLFYKLHKFMSKKEEYEWHLIKLYSILGKNIFSSLKIDTINTIDTIDLPLTIILDNINISSNLNKTAFMDVVMDFDKNELRNQIEVYRYMKDLNEMVLEEVDDILKKAFPYAIYIMRNNFLSDFYGEFTHGRKLYYENNKKNIIVSDKGLYETDDMIFVFLNKILNTFYVKTWKENQIKFTFDKKKFNEHFLKTHRKEFEDFDRKARFEEQIQKEKTDHF